MKLTEIKPLVEGAIYNTIEYKLSSDELQRYAFLSKAPKKLPQEICDMYNVKFDDVEVTTNVGTKIKYEIGFEKNEWPVLKAAPQQRSFKDPETGKYRTYYMVKGSKPTQKTAVWFYATDVEAKIKRNQERYWSAVRAYNEAFSKDLQIELREKLPPAARKALEDNLLDLIKERDNMALYNWFKAEGFTKRDGELPTPEEFKKMSSIMGWNVHTDNRYRATQGVDMKIDWVKKEFYTVGWSSDD